METTTETNKFRKILNSGDFAMGIYIFVPSEAVVDILGWAGFDFVILDTEHASYDLKVMENLVRTAEARNMATIARIGAFDALLTQRVLDTGVDGVMFARVSSRQEAETAVRLSKLGPSGDRGACPGMRAGKYFLMSEDEYDRRANEIVVGVMIKTKQGLEHAEEIISVPGIDFIRTGSSDLAWSMGLKRDDPRVRKGMERIANLAKAAGVNFMEIAHNSRQVAEALQRDSNVRLFFSITDSYHMGKYFQGLIQESRNYASQYPRK